MCLQSGLKWEIMGGKSIGGEPVPIRICYINILIGVFAIIISPISDIKTPGSMR